MWIYRSTEAAMNDLLDRTIRHAETKAETRGAVNVYYTKFHYTPQQISQEIDVPEDTINEIIKELQRETAKKEQNS